MKKRCTKCGVEKDISEFWKEKTHKDGRRSWCKDCDREKGKRWRKLNPKRKRELHKNWRTKNKIKLTKKKKIFYQKNKDKILAQKKDHYNKNREKVLEQCKKYREGNKKIMRKRKSKYYFNNKDKIKDYTLRKYYDISLEDYKKILKKQNDRCAICERPSKYHKKDFFVDHNHKTGKVRGLLCTKCNFALGQFDEDIKILNNAIKYLRKYK